jgi:ankyrin repeat protein
MEGQFDNLNFLNIENKNEYYCSKITKSKGFTPLMVLTQQTIEDSTNFEQLKNYLNELKDSINEKNEKGWTALHLLCRNYNSEISIKLVDLFLKNEYLNVNLQNNDGWTCLMLGILFKMNQKHVPFQEPIVVMK